LILRLGYLALLVSVCTTLVPTGARAGDTGDPGTIMTEQFLLGCESLHVCGQPGPNRWSIDLTVGGVGDQNVLSEELIDPVHGSTIRGVASAQFGRLGVSAFVDPPEGFFGSGPDMAEMRAGATYEDIVTLFGPPGGSDVPLTFTQVLSGFVDPPFGAPFGAGFAALVTQVYLGGFGVGPPVLTLSNTSQSPLLPRTGVVSVPVQTELFVRQTLNVVASAGSGSPPLNSVWIDTGVLHLDVAAPGYSIRSVSGHDYASPIPEAGTAALTTCGLLLLSGARRLQRQSGRHTAAR